MLGFLYKIFRLNWLKLLLIFIAMSFYPLGMTALLYFDSSGLTDGISIMINAVVGFLAFLIGGFGEDSIFNGDEQKKWAYYVASAPAGIKRQLGAKYLFTVMWAMLTFALLALCNVAVRSKNGGSTDVYFVLLGLFCAQLYVRSLEFPLMVRFGGKNGKTVKIVIIGVILFVLFVYALFGDASAFNDMSSFWDTLFSTLSDPEKRKKLKMWFGVLCAASVPIYWLSYRLSVKWYIKGTENYVK